MHASIRSLISVSVTAALITVAFVCTPAASAADQGLVGWGEYKLPNAERGTIAKIAAGRNFTLALRTDGTLVGWGADGGHAATPPAGNDYTAIAVGIQHALALKADKTIVAWGFDQYGEARNPPAGTFLAIAAGETTNVAIRTDGSSPGQGSLQQWGAALRPEPQFALPTGNDFVAVAAGVGHFLALRADGSIAAWGPLGLSQANAPTGTGFTAIAAGGYHCLALRSDGSIAAWGTNLFGQATAPAGTGFTAIAGGGSHSLARKADGSILVWGYPYLNVLDGPTGTGFNAIAGGELHSVALRADGTVTEWGQTGFGLTAPYTGVTQAVASQFHGLALMADGSLVGWGANAYGQAAPPAGNNFKTIAVGLTHSIALRTDGSIAVWGKDNSGDPPPTETGFLAIGAARDHNVAIKADHSLAFWGTDPSSISTLPPGNDFTAIAVGGSHCLALKSDGSIVGWGLNTNGQATPPVGTGFIAIAAGNTHSLALKSDGSIVAWGANFFGQATAPTATTYTAIGAGGDLSGAVTTAGSLVTWGRGILGGTGTPPAGTGFTKVSAGVTYFMALGISTPPPPPTPAPVPVITSPTPGASYRHENLDLVSMVAEVPGDLSVLKGVDFFLNGQSVAHWGSGFVSPFTFQFYPNQGGVDYTFFVRTETLGGQTATSAPVLFYTISSLENCFLGTIQRLLYPAPKGAANGAGRKSSIEGQLARALAASTLAVDDLDVFRNFRDQVLSTTPAGRYYTDLYNRMSLPMIETVLAHPTQMAPIYDALLEWTPAIQALVNNQGGTVTITPAMAAHAQTVLTNLRAVATGELAAIMDAETTALNPNTWSGQSIGQLLGRVESQTRPPPGISAHPAVQAVTSGGTATFSVAPSGAGPFTYQWFKDGVAIAGATASTYSLQSGQRFHAGAYSVAVTNPFGMTTSNAAALTISAPPSNNARLLNLSTRGLAQTGDSVLIPGFVVGGTGTKKLLIRAVGPTLSHAPFNVSGTLGDPRMTLKRLVGSTYVDVASNDNWISATNAAAITSTAASLFAFPFDDDHEAALLVDLAPGQYTVIADGVANVTGVGIVELYDADAPGTTSRLINISNRGFAGLGDQVMIPGFVVSSEGPKTLLVRVVGPTLGAAPFNVAGTMTDPKLTVYRTINGLSTELFSQDNWSESADAANTSQIAQQVFAFALNAGSKDAAFVITLDPGVYTIVGSSAAAGGTGIVLVEVYVVP